MTITYTWEFSQFDTKPSFEGLANVVACIHWRLTGNDDEGYTASNYGTVNLLPPSREQFIPYDNITKDETISWMDSCMDVATVKDSIAQQIAQQKNPPVVSMVPPFDTVIE